MIKRALMLAVAVMVAACNSSPSQTIENTVGGANVVSSAKSPLKMASPNLTLDWGSKGQPGQVAIGVVLTYGGSKPTITAAGRMATDSRRRHQDDAPVTLLARGAGQ